MTDNFRKLLCELSRTGVRYVIIGGFAGAAYGCKTLTQELEICCDFAPDNLLRLQEVLRRHKPVHRMTPGKVPLRLTPENCKDYKNLYLDTDLGQLDCLSYVAGVGDFTAARKDAKAIKVDDETICVLSLDALIEAKKAMNRPRDRYALAQLQAIKQLEQEQGH
jgi:hypothetical protein